nr:VC0807 family protein [Ornithinimicrobium sp. F0845]
MGALVVELVLDVGLGLLAYWVVVSAGWGVTTALVVAGAVAVLRAAWATVRRGTLDPTLALIVLTFLLTLALSLVSGDARVLLLKGSAGLALFGLVAAGSLVWGRPLLFSIVRRFVAPGESGRREWEELWQGSSPFRWLYHRLTLVWAVTYLLAAGAHAAAVLALPVEVTAPLLRTATPALWLLMVGWTIWFTRRAERSLDRPLLDAAADLAAPTRP